MFGNTFINSLLNYALLIWKKGLYLKMHNLHHKTLKVIYQSNKAYEELLELSQTVSIHQRHINNKEIPHYLRKGQSQVKRKSDLVIVNKMEKTPIIIDMALPGDKKIFDKEKKKIEKYPNLKREIQRLWNLKKIDVIPVVFGKCYKKL